MLSSPPPQLPDAQRRLALPPVLQSPQSFLACTPPPLQNEFLSRGGPGERRQAPFEGLSLAGDALAGSVSGFVETSQNGGGGICGIAGEGGGSFVSSQNALLWPPPGEAGRNCGGLSREVSGASTCCSASELATTPVFAAPAFASTTALEMPLADSLGAARGAETRLSLFADDARAAASTSAATSFSTLPASAAGPRGSDLARPVFSTHVPPDFSSEFPSPTPHTQNAQQQLRVSVQKQPSLLDSAFSNFGFWWDANAEPSANANCRVTNLETSSRKRRLLRGASSFPCAPSGGDCQGGLVASSEFSSVPSGGSCWGGRPQGLEEAAVSAREGEGPPQASTESSANKAGRAKRAKLTVLDLLDRWAADSDDEEFVLSGHSVLAERRKTEENFLRQELPAQRQTRCREAEPEGGGASAPLTSPSSSSSCSSSSSSSSDDEDDSVASSDGDSGKSSEVHSWAGQTSDASADSDSVCSCPSSSPLRTENPGEEPQGTNQQQTTDSARSGAGVRPSLSRGPGLAACSVSSPAVETNSNSKNSSRLLWNLRRESRGGGGASSSVVRSCRRALLAVSASRSPFSLWSVQHLLPQLQHKDSPAAVADASPTATGFSRQQIRRLQMHLDLYVQLLMQAVYACRNAGPLLSVAATTAGAPSSSTAAAAPIPSSQEGGHAFADRGVGGSSAARNFRRFLNLLENLLHRRLVHVNELRASEGLAPLQLRGSLRGGEEGADFRRVDDCSGLVPFPGCQRRSSALTEGDAPRRCMADIPLLRKLKQFMLLVEDADSRYPHTLWHFLELQQPFVDEAFFRICDPAALSARARDRRASLQGEDFFTSAEDRLLGLGLSRVGRRHFAFVGKWLLPCKSSAAIARRFKALQRRWQASKDLRNPLSAWRCSLERPFSPAEDRLLLSHPCGGGGGGCTCSVERWLFLATRSGLARDVTSIQKRLRRLRRDAAARGLQQQTDAQQAALGSLQTETTEAAEAGVEAEFERSFCAASFRTPPTTPAAPCTAAPDSCLYTQAQQQLPLVSGEVPRRSVFAVERRSPVAQSSSPVQQPLPPQIPPSPLQQQPPPPAAAPLSEAGDCLEQRASSLSFGLSPQTEEPPQRLSRKTPAAVGLLPSPAESCTAAEETLGPTNSDAPPPDAAPLFTAAPSAETLSGGVCDNPLFDAANFVVPTQPALVSPPTSGAASVPGGTLAFRVFDRSGALSQQPPTGGAGRLPLDASCAPVYVHPNPGSGDLARPPSPWRSAEGGVSSSSTAQLGSGRSKALDGVSPGTARSSPGASGGAGCIGRSSQGPRGVELSRVCAPFYGDVTSIAEALDEMPFDFFDKNLNCQLPAAMVFEPVVQSVINCDCRMFGAKPKPARIGLRIIRAKRTAPPSLKVKHEMQSALLQEVKAKGGCSRVEDSQLPSASHQAWYWSASPPPPPRPPCIEENQGGCCAREAEGFPERISFAVAEGPAALSVHPTPPSSFVPASCPPPPALFAEPLLPQPSASCQLALPEAAVLPASSAAVPQPPPSPLAQQPTLEEPGTTRSAESKEIDALVLQLLQAAQAPGTAEVQSASGGALLVPPAGESSASTTAEQSPEVLFFGENGGGVGEGEGEDLRGSRLVAQLWMCLLPSVSLPPLEKLKEVQTQIRALFLKAAAEEGLGSDLRSVTEEAALQGEETRTPAEALALVSPQEGGGELAGKDALTAAPSPFAASPERAESQTPRSSGAGEEAAPFARAPAAVDAFSPSPSAAAEAPVAQQRAAAVVPEPLHFQLSRSFTGYDWTPPPLVARRSQTQSQSREAWERAAAAFASASWRFDSPCSQQKSSLTTGSATTRHSPEGSAFGIRESQQQQCKLPLVCIDMDSWKPPPEGVSAEAASIGLGVAASVM